MPRQKRTVPDELTQLRARARQLEESAVSESVLIDAKTYGSLVSFIETEGCTLREGIRRALKIGVAALLADYENPPQDIDMKTPQEIMQELSTLQNRRPDDIVAKMLQTQFTPVTAPVTDNLRENMNTHDDGHSATSVDYSVKAPPGM